MQITKPTEPNEPKITVQLQNQHLKLNNKIIKNKKMGKKKNKNQKS